MSTTLLDLTDCTRARNRVVFAIDKRRKSHAVKLLTTAYLPALRDLAAGTDPERIDAELATLERRLTRGADYEAEDDERQEEADDLFVELLDRYCVLVDAKNLEGVMPTTRYWLDHIELTMLMPKEPANASAD